MQRGQQNTATNQRNDPGRKRTTTINKQLFAYDEMVMASDGTRFFIKFLDTSIKPGQPMAPNHRVQRVGTNIGATTITRTTVQVRPPMDANRMAPSQPVRLLNGQTRTVRIGPKPSSLQTPLNMNGKRPAEDAAASNNGGGAGNIFKCDICQKPFSQRPALTMHMQTHRDAMVTCPCGRKFAARPYMLKHQKHRFETEGVRCEDNPAPKNGAGENSSTTAESAREILRKGLSSLKSNEIELTDTQITHLKDWIKERFKESKLTFIIAYSFNINQQFRFR